MESEPPLIVWNHRWEYDKNPIDFFHVLYSLSEKQIKFKLVILGQQFKSHPVTFDEAKEKLKEEIIHCGFVSSKREYCHWLKRADIIPVTAIHDFFGESVVQGIYWNCYPILPNRLAYKEHIPEKYHHKFLYNTISELEDKLEKAILEIEKTRNTNVKNFVTDYDWKHIIHRYDFALESLMEQND